MITTESLPEWDYNDFTTSLNTCAGYLFSKAIKQYSKGEDAFNEFYFIDSSGVETLEIFAEDSDEECESKVLKISEQMPDMIAAFHLHTHYRTVDNSDEGIGFFRQVFGDVQLIEHETEPILLVECIEVAAVFGLARRIAYAIPVTQLEDEFEPGQLVDLLPYEPSIPFDELLSTLFFSRGYYNRKNR